MKLYNAAFDYVAFSPLRTSGCVINAVTGS